MSNFDDDVEQAARWLESDRFAGITRLFSARQVAEQRGTIINDYAVAKTAAATFYSHLRNLFSNGESITTFGPYSPGQAVVMKRMGIEGIYLGGWATSAKGSVQEDPGPDLASYPLSQVPDEAAVLVRALLSADKNQKFARARMTPEEQADTAEVNFMPWIIADADTGHGGDGHVRNLVRRFVEVGVPGYHIEDQKPGAKKCGHQGGKVLVPCDEQIKRLNAARFQLDIMGVGGIIVARTDAEAASLLDGGSDERDQPFILGVTNTEVPSYKVAYLTLLKHLHGAGLTDINGHLLYSIPVQQTVEAEAWLGAANILESADTAAAEFLATPGAFLDNTIDAVVDLFATAWETAAGLTTYGQAVADRMEFRAEQGEQFDMDIEQWLAFAGTASQYDAVAKADELGLNAVWDSELAKTPEGYYQIKGGIPYAIAKSLAVTPFCDILWMETKTADLADAKEFAAAIHAVFPDQMMAYNLSPSFSWDTTGMTDEEMTAFPAELGKLGFVFNFITYGGHQVDGMASEEFSTALQEEGMLALAKLQRKLRLVESPYRTPQTLVGGPRADAGLVGASGRTATTRAMGKGSTQFQHLVQTEVPPRLLEEWLQAWCEHNGIDRTFKVALRPASAGSEILELRVTDDDGTTVADVIFSQVQDRRKRAILSVRDQNVYDESLRRKRLMTLLHLFVLHRYKIESIHYLTPTDDNHKMAENLLNLEIFDVVADEVGEIIVADVKRSTVRKLVAEDGAVLNQLITKG
ncbi:MAG: isocitrate lyase/phosphoenolpyruvate mutase family protein [Acidimicrobiales bacterium]